MFALTDIAIYFSTKLGNDEMKRLGKHFWNIGLSVVGTRRCPIKGLLAAMKEHTDLIPDNSVA